ncbi:hypothetical protein [Spiroplasma endosymbiont of Virgichneumon dumeticola]|uniref:hypothetical protein n=1 Tax=Spiroplasma endosymbiont of Virgichneumon dumeticola TaxID=3139323 RepID=UPI0035C8E47C
MNFLLEKLYELRNIKIKKLTVWSLIGVGTLQLNNMWNVLATKINSGKEISFFSFTWWKEEILEYSLTISVIGTSIAGIFWMNFIQVGAMNCIWNNIKKSFGKIDNNDEKKILIKRLTELEEKYNKLLLLINTDKNSNPQSNKRTVLLQEDILNINNEENLLNSNNHYNRNHGVTL